MIWRRELGGEEKGRGDGEDEDVDVVVERED
jgi:hypothetical protein